MMSSHENRKAEQLSSETCGRKIHSNVGTQVWCRLPRLPGRSRPRSLLLPGYGVAMETAYCDTDKSVSSRVKGCEGTTPLFSRERRGAVPDPSMGPNIIGPHDFINHVLN